MILKYSIDCRGKRVGGVMEWFFIPPYPEGGWGYGNGILAWGHVKMPRGSRDVGGQNRMPRVSLNSLLRNSEWTSGEVMGSGMEGFW